MDKFQQFGELMNQFDSAMSPGDIRRKLTDKSLMGMEMRGGGGGGGGDSGPDWEEVADLQHEQAMNSYNYDWDNTQRSYNHMLLQNEIQRNDQIKQHLYQTSQQKQQWMYANAQQEQQYNSQVAAFNKSEKMYGWQVDMNQISADMALDEQRVQTNERYKALMFEATEADLTYQFDQQEADSKHQYDLTDASLKRTKADIDYNKQKTDLSMQGMAGDLDIYSKRTAGQRQKQGLTIDQQTKRGQAAAQSVEDVVKGMQAAGQVEAKGQTGRSATKQYQSMVAQTARLQAVKAYELNRSDIATRLALNGVDQTMAEQETAANLSNAKIGIAGITADAGYKITKDSLKNAEDYMQHMYDLGTGRRNDMYNLGVDQRAATKLSIGGAHDRANKKIAHDQYAANVQADFSRMSEPSKGIPIPKPLEIPMATILDPIVPVRGEPPVWGAGGGMGPSSGGSTGGGGVGGALGVASAGFSALGAAGSLAATGGGTIGLFGAGTIGLAAMGPIGLGLMAVGGIGMAAGWW